MPRPRPLLAALLATLALAAPARATLPEVLAFTASPGSVFPDQPATLTWLVTPPGATVTIDAGVGTVPTAGTRTVTVPQTTTFTLRATVPGTGSITAEATVTVDPGVPLAAPQALAATAATPLRISLGATDPDGGRLTFEILTPPPNATLTGTPPDLVFTADPGFTGSTGFTFAATDDRGNRSSPATVSVDVAPGPSPPAAVRTNRTRVPADVPVGNYVTHLFAEDPNAADSHTFAVLGDTALFRVDGNILRTAVRLDAFAGTVMTVPLRVTDITRRHLDTSIQLEVEPFRPEVVINEVAYDDDHDTLATEFVELFNPTDTAVDLSGWRLAGAIDLTLRQGTTIPPRGYLVAAASPSALETPFAPPPGTPVAGPWSGRLANDGEPLRLVSGRGDTVDQIDYRPAFPWPVAPAAPPFSIGLLHHRLDNASGAAWRALTAPNPGRANNPLTPNAPPVIDNVTHTPSSPASGTPITVSADLTDPHGVAGVTLEFQTVAPGDYIPAYLPHDHAQLIRDPARPRRPNPAYHDPANWRTLPMRQLPGTDTFTATIDPLPHRTLLRYRITFADAAAVPVAARAPFPGDPSLNFAAFVYDGVPDYQVDRSVTGGATTYPAETLTKLPVYTLITRDADLRACLAWPVDGVPELPEDHPDARRAYNWDGCFVAGGVAYDHLTYRLRGARGRYHLATKRSMKFRFNRGRPFRPVDLTGRPYPRPWRVLETSKMFGNRLAGPFGTRDRPGNFGLVESLNNRLWQLAGVPAPDTHHFHFRVVDSAGEAPDQWSGDFWGLGLAVERLDARFLDARGLDGNLYKLSTGVSGATAQQRHQARGAVRDGSDYATAVAIAAGGHSTAWLRDHVDLARWYSFRAVAEAVRHHDYAPLADKNMAYWFPADSYSAANAGRGKLVLLPYDHDASWGPTWQRGIDPVGAAAADDPQLQLELRNAVRSFRDLAWQRDQVLPMLNDLADLLTDFAAADRDRWTNAPVSEGRYDFGTLSSKVNDMALWAFTGGWRYPGGDAPPGGSAAVLDGLAFDPHIPDKPTITYSGAPRFPAGALAFTTSPFDDPQGDHTAAAVAWRIAEVAATEAPIDLTAAVRPHELTATWESGERPAAGRTVTPPATAVRPGRTYRARVRHADTTDRWSHWSDPLEFVATAPDLSAYTDHLVVSEVHYHPAPPSASERADGFTAGDFEWIEIHNNGPDPLDLTPLRFTKGIDFDFVHATRQVLEPGTFAVVARNPEAFNDRYPDAPVGAVLSDWQPGDRLDNAGERIKLSFGAGIPVRDFTYGDDSPWPTAPDGHGPSLVLADHTAGAPASDHGDPASWRASILPGGTPGAPPAYPELVTWMAATGTPGLDDDADRDGLPALLEFALSSDPAAPSPGALPSPSRISLEGSAYPALTFTQRHTDAVDLTVEQSADLLTWTPADTVVHHAVASPDNTRTVTLRLTTPAAPAYLRLRASLSPR